MIPGLNAAADHGIGFGAHDPAQDALNQSFASAEHKGTPTPSEIVDGLPDRPLGISVLEREPQCAVCGEHFKVGGVATALPCGHHFVSAALCHTVAALLILSQHRDCVTPWLKTHSNCPVCRFALVADDGTAAPPPLPSLTRAHPKPKSEPEPEPQIEPETDTQRETKS